MTPGELERRFPRMVAGSGHSRCDDFCLCSHTRAQTLRQVAAELRIITESDLALYTPSMAIKAIECLAAELEGVPE